MNLSILGLVRAVERAAATGERIVLDVGEGKRLALVPIEDLERLRGHARSSSAPPPGVDLDAIVDLTDQLDEETIEATSKWESEGGAAASEEAEPLQIDVTVVMH